MMRQRQLLCLVLLMASVVAVGKKKVVVKQELWPNGEPMAEWFSDTTKVKVQDLGRQYVLTDYGVRQGTTDIQTKAIQGVYDIDPLFRLKATLRYTSANGKWSLVAQGDNILNDHIYTRSTIGNQDYAMRIWMPYTRYSLTAIYRIGNFKEKKKNKVDTSRMGY